MHRTVPRKFRSRKAWNFGRVRVQDRPASRATGTVDERVQATEFLIQRLKQSIDRVLIRDVGHDSLNLCPLFFQVGRGALQGDRMDIRQEQFRTCGGKMRGQPPAQSGGAARNHHDFALPIVHHTTTCLGLAAPPHSITRAPVMSQFRAPHVRSSRCCPAACGSEDAGRDSTERMVLLHFTPTRRGHT